MNNLVDRRRQSLPPEMLMRIFLAWIAICAILLTANIGAILALRFPSPDDIMRLIQVRDLLAGQSWFDLTQYRADAVNGGVSMHWSRLVDLPLVAVIFALSPLIGQGAAEMAALIVVPLGTLGMALLLVGRVVWRLVGDEAAGLACLAMGLSAPILAQFMPLRIDDRGWQIVLALAAVNGLMARSPRTGGWAIGLSLAVWTSISIEGLPFALVFCAITALRWLRNRQDRAWLVHTMQALAAGSVALFALTRGFGDLAPYCDAISPVHLAIFGMGAVGATLLARLEPMPRFAQLAGFGVTAAAGTFILWSAAPQCLNGGLGPVDPRTTEFWYPAGDNLLAWERSPGIAMQMLVPPLIGIFAALQLAARSSDWLRRWWFEYALLLAFALGVALFVSSAGAIACALASIPLGWQIREWMRSARHIRRPGRKVLAMSGIALALLPAMPLSLLTLAAPAHAANAGSFAGERECAIAQSASVLRRLPKGEILAPHKISRQLLYETGHTAIAAGQHRGPARTRAVAQAFRGSPHAAHAFVQQRGTAYVALCPDGAELTRYVAAAPDGFAAQLLDGRIPNWLEPIETPASGRPKLWKVRD